MANEIKYSGLGDLRLAETLNREVLLALADRNVLQNHPALLYVGDATATGSTVIKTSEIAWDGATQLASTAESASPTNTALVDASHQVTVARYSKQYQVTGLASITDSLGMFNNPAFWAQDSVMSAGMTMTALLGALVGGFATVKGSTGVNLSLAQYFDALSALELANVQGPKMAVLHPVQWHDLQTALRAESGTALAYAPATLEQITVRGEGYKGMLYGADVFVSAQVPTVSAGADRAGGVFGKGAIGWADATPIIDSSADALIAGKTLVAMEYDASSDQKKVVTSAYMGVSELIDLAGVSIISDA